MLKLISKISTIFLIFLIIISFTGCCFNFTPVIDEIKNKISISKSAADFEMIQDGAGSYYFAKDNPVTFKFLNKDNLDLQKVKFSWNIDGNINLEGSQPSYTFNQAGKHTVSLMISQGMSSSNMSKSFYICDQEGQFLIIKKHNVNVAIKYILANNGPGEITKVQCGIESPLDNGPFQIVEGINTETKNFNVVTDENGNNIYKFSLQNIDQYNQIAVTLSSDIVINEFIIKKSDSMPQEYEQGDKDLAAYTQSEKYVDSDSEAISKAAEAIIGNETIPAKKAELIYNFVCNKLEYDYAREAQKDKKIYNASEILNLDKGVCVDYSILFAALCRAAGIPAKLIYGLGLQAMVSKPGESPDAASDGSSFTSTETHEWNEIKLPGYGWIPIDATREQPFLTPDYFCDLKTFEGAGILYESIKIDNTPAYPIGFFYYYNDVQPATISSFEYSVSGLSAEDFAAPIYDKADLEQPADTTVPISAVSEETTASSQETAAAADEATSSTEAGETETSGQQQILYANTQYGFNFSLPGSWLDYSIVVTKWEGNPSGSEAVSEQGPIISIRNPKWTEENPYQDIPIMIFTLAQWDLMQSDKFHIGAAPIGPAELGRNSRYVFALPARYNFAYPTGWEEVEKILKGSPLQAY